MTRDPKRIDIVLDALEEYWKDNPDLRLAQIVTNMYQEKHYVPPEQERVDPFHMEDGALTHALMQKNCDKRLTEWDEIGDLFQE